MTKALSQVGFNALIYDDSRNRMVNRLDDVDHARDAETFSPDLGTRLVFVRDVDPEEYLSSDHKTIAVVDLAPDPEDVESLEVLRRFDAVWGLSRWVVEELRRGRVEAQWIGRSFEAAEQAYLPRHHFGLPDSARVVVLPFDADEFFSPGVDGINEAYVQALLQADTSGDLRIAIISPAMQPDMPDFPDDPRISYHDLTEDDYLADSLLNTADCVVSFDTFLRVAKSLGRAQWLGRPVLAMGTSADGDLPFQVSLDGPASQDVDLDQLAEQYVRKTVAFWSEDAANGRAADVARGRLLTEVSHRAVGLRLMEKLNEIPS